MARPLAGVIAALVASAAVIACEKAYSDAIPAGGGDDDDDSGTSSGGTKVTTTVTNDAGATDAATETTDGATDDAAAQASTVCPSTAPATTPPFNPPASAPAMPCTQADLNLFLADEGKSFDAAKADQVAQNAACASCIYTLQSDAVWGPIVKTDDGRRFVNFGLCYYGADTSDACSLDAFNFEWCRQKVCNVCSTGETSAACLTDAENNACASTFSKTTTDCTAHDRNLISQFCNASGDVVQFICGPNTH